MNQKFLQGYVKAICINRHIHNPEDIRDIIQEVMLQISEHWNYDPNYMSEDNRHARISTYLYVAISRCIAHWREKQKPEPKSATFMRKIGIIQSENYDEDVRLNLNRLHDFILNSTNLSSSLREWLLTVLWEFCTGLNAREVIKVLHKMGIRGPHTRAISDMWVSYLKARLKKLTQRFIREGRCVAFQGGFDDSDQLQEDF